MSDRPPRVTIGLPVHDGERFLAEAIDSLLGQSYADLELVISDNGSTDGTEAICRAYAAADRRVRYHRMEVNRGACWNFNRVVELARGEYFKWAAADDVCAPTFVERCVEVLDGDPGIVCCHARTVKIDADGRPLPDLPDPTDGGVPPAVLSNGRRRPDASSTRADLRFRDVLLTIGWGARSYAVIRTAALRRTGLIRPAYGSEKVMMAELSLLGRFHDVSEPLFFQREHGGASSVLTSVREQQAFFDPELADHRTYPRLELLRGFVGAALSAPVAPLERGLCLVWVIRYLFQVSKWGAIWQSIVHQTGARRS